MTDDLLAEWDRLQGRAYAEEGIPAIVVVEGDGALAVPRRDGLADAFRAVAERLTPHRPASPEGILELLAARELGGPEAADGDERP